ncbi:hypothetical protein ACLOJK_014079 [Asimina triloba]
MCGLPLEGPSPSLPSLTRLPPAPALLRGPLPPHFPLRSPTTPFSDFDQSALPSPASAPPPSFFPSLPRISSIPSLPPLSAIPSLHPARRSRSFSLSFPFPLRLSHSLSIPFSVSGPASLSSPSFLRRLPLPLSSLIRLRSRAPTLSGPALSLSLTLSLSPLRPYPSTFPLPPCPGKGVHEAENEWQRWQ